MSIEILIKFELIMVLVWVLNTLVLLNYQLLLPLLFYMMFYMFLILPKIWALCINLPLILIHPLNFTILISLWRIEQRRKFCYTGWVEMGCTYFLLLSIKSIFRHLLLLVNVLLQISGTHTWDILLFVLFFMFYLDLACLLVQINLFTLVLLVSVQINLLSCTHINFPLELIYIDVWGPSPICSKSGSKYCLFLGCIQLLYLALSHDE